MIKIALSYFLLILGGALLSAVLGGIFAWIIALISPDFVRDLVAGGSPRVDIVGYAAAMGMLWGLFIGAAAAGFGCFLSTAMQLIRLRVEHTTKN